MANRRLGERAKHLVSVLRGASRWRVALWCVAGLLLVVATVSTAIDPGAMWPNLAAEAAGLAFTVLVVEVIAAKQSEEREKRDLILQMGSPDNAFAREAVRKLRVRGWLEDGSLHRANLVLANLSGANLVLANLSGANLYDADLRGANLREADLTGADLGGANLERANLVVANLGGAILSEADLSGANLYGADLGAASLERANLSGALLSGADLSGANLYGADLGAANLTGANLSEADLRWANLERADLRWANLSGANLSGADLYGADLSGANLSQADLYGAIVTYEQPAQAKTLEGATLPDGTKYTSETELEPTPTETTSGDTEERPPDGGLRAARERAGLTQKELADRAGVSPSTVGRWEREGTVPRSAEVRRKVAEMVGWWPWPGDGTPKRTSGR
jgi:uncharacterized protein YjbI with pentapeptide repeats/DNA-binding XRE family transcriptional regulator